jgi:hypothetical protein
MSEKKLANIEVGSRVWLADYYGERRRDLKTVAKLTPTQIVLDNGWRYYRSNGYAIGRSLYKIIAAATPEECARHDAERAEEKRAEAERRAESEAREAKHIELNDLFGENVHVQSTHTNEAGEWQVCMYLSEEGVRKLAELTKNMP